MDVFTIQPDTIENTLLPMKREHGRGSRLMKVLVLQSSEKNMTENKIKTSGVFR